MDLGRGHPLKANKRSHVPGSSVARLLRLSGDMWNLKSADTMRGCCVLIRQVVLKRTWWLFKRAILHESLLYLPECRAYKSREKPWKRRAVLVGGS